MAPHTIDINREKKIFHPTSNNTIQLPTNSIYSNSTTTTTATTANEILFQQQQQQELQQQSYYQQQQQQLVNQSTFIGNYNNTTISEFDSINYLPQATTTTLTTTSNTNNITLNTNNCIDYSPNSIGNTTTTTTTPSPIGATSTFGTSYSDNQFGYFEGEEEVEDCEFDEKNFESMISNNQSSNNVKLMNMNMNNNNNNRPYMQYDDESCSQNQYCDLFSNNQLMNSNEINNTFQLGANNGGSFDSYLVKQEPVGYDDFNNQSAYPQTYQQQQQYHPQQQLQQTFNQNLSQQQPTTNTKSTKGQQKKRDEVRYGPIVVRPRVQAAPTLLTGRKSKYINLSAEEERKRELRRSRNRAAAEKCKKKRLEIEDSLNKTLSTLRDQNKSLSREFEQLTRQRDQLKHIAEQVRRNCNVNYQQQQQQYQQTQNMNYYNNINSNNTNVYCN